MKVVVADSRVSEQSHDGSHFLRGVIAELEGRGHQVHALALTGRSGTTLETFDVDAELDGAELVLVSALSDPELIAGIGAHRSRHDDYRLLFHDTHPARTAPEEAGQPDLSDYDGVLASGEALRQAYLERGRAARAWTWHEAVDTRVFHPLPTIEPEADLVWIGDWGDDIRSRELCKLLRPARNARLHGHLYGDGYPASARLRLRLSGLRYCGSTHGDRIPELFARHRLTVHLPPVGREGAPPDAPTSYFFEALACGIPLISAPWDDGEGLFRPEQDYLLARDCAEMREAMQAILEFPEFAAQLRENGLETIRAHHTCAHRADELLAIDAELKGARLELAG